MSALPPRINARLTALRRAFMAQPHKLASGIYQFRRKVPEELRPFLGREYKQSLKTRDPAEAKARHAKVWLECEEAFALAKEQALGGEVLGERDAQVLAAKWFRTEQERIESTGDFEAWLVPTGTVGNEQGDHYEEHSVFETYGQALGDQFLNEGDLVSVIDRAVRSSLPKQMQNLRLGQEAHERLHAAFRAHLLRLSDLAMSRYDGDWLVQANLLPAEPLSVERRQRTKPERRLEQLFEEFCEDKILNDGDTRGVRKTLAGYRATIEQFIELTGDVPLEKIDRETARSYRAMIAKLPAKGKGLRGLTASQQIDMADTKGLPLIAAPTIRNKLRAVSAVLGLAVRMGYIQENPIVAGGIGRAAAKAAGGSVGGSRRRKDYTKEELGQIFSSAIYTDQGWRAPKADFGAAWYWLPLLMYYTGARREELAQLAVKDVCKDGGVDYLSILAADDEDAGKGVKNRGSRRRIPLHSDLVNRGFLDYAKSVPQDGQLFPRLVPSPSGYYGANFGKRWAVYLRDVVGLRSTASPSHGFRHTFKTLSREVGIPEDVHDAITGHVAGNAVARSYGGMPLARMSQEIARLPLVGLLGVRA